MYQGAAGRTPQEKEKNACIGAKCPLFPTKANTKIALETVQKINGVLYGAVELRKERLSGGSIDKSRIPARVFTCLKMLDDFYDAFERDLRVDNKKYLELLIKKPTL